MSVNSPQLGAVCCLVTVDTVTPYCRDNTVGLPTIAKAKLQARGGIIKYRKAGLSSLIDYAPLLPAERNIVSNTESNPVDEAASSGT